MNRWWCLPWLGAAGSWDSELKKGDELCCYSAVLTALWVGPSQGASTTLVVLAR